MPDATPRLARFSLPLDRPLSTARGDIEVREGALVGVTLDGSRGVGEATPLPGWTESLADCLAALDRCPLDDWTSRLDGAPAAAHGVQSALLDATARDRDERLADLLAARIGGRAASRVPVNATVGDGDERATVAAARDATGAGFGTVKVKVGARPLDADLARVRAVADAIDARVRLDANGAWDRETATRAVDALADLDVEYVEQPLDPGDLDGLAALRGRGIDVAVDESLARDGPGIAAVLDADAADVAVLKPMALGGPGAAVDLAAGLRSRGVDPVVTTTVDGAVARAAAVHVAAALPDVRACGLATGDRLAEDLGADPSPVADGHATVPSGPGIAGDAFDDYVW